MSVAPVVDLAVVTPTIPQPQNRNCVTQSSGLGGLNKNAHFTWTAPAGGVVPSGYVIRARNGATTNVIFTGPGTATSADITLSLLQGLGGAVSWLLTLLLGGPTAGAPVTINAVYGDYESPNNFTHQLTGVPPLSLGVGCSTFSGGAGLAAAPPPPTTTTTPAATTTTPATTTTTLPPPTTTTVPSTSSVPATTTTMVATTSIATTVPPTTTTVPATTVVATTTTPLTTTTTVG